MANKGVKTKLPYYVKGEEVLYHSKRHPGVPFIARIRDVGTRSISGKQMWYKISIEELHREIMVQEESLRKCYQACNSTWLDFFKKEIKITE